jgi:effector-binding domain-containing protein
MDIVNIVLFSFSIISFLLLIYSIVRFNIQKRKMLALYIQSEMDKYLIVQKLEQVSKELSTRELSETDGFVKFISQSRDWAFEYIEEVQKALTEFDEEVAPRLEWANTFGRLAGETVHTDTIKTISEAYKKLKEVLPKDNQTPNN